MTRAIEDHQAELVVPAGITGSVKEMDTSDTTAATMGTVSVRISWSSSERSFGSSFSFFHSLFLPSACFGNGQGSGSRGFIMNDACNAPGACLENRGIITSGCCNYEDACQNNGNGVVIQPGDGLCEET